MKERFAEDCRFQPLKTRVKCPVAGPCCFSDCASARISQCMKK